MYVVACIKQVPDTTQVQIDPVTNTLVRDGIEKNGRMVGVSGIFKMSAADHNGLDLSAFEMVRIEKGDWAIAR